MKIYIGPYKDWVGPYQIADKLFFWIEKYPEDEALENRWDYKFHDRFGTWLDSTWVSKACNWYHKKFQKRKIKIRIDNYDTWGMDHTLALIILPMLRQLRADKHGSPGDMLGFQQTSNSSTQKCFEFYEEGDDAAWEAGHQQWMEIMDKMIWSFEQIVDDNWEEQYWITEPEIDLSDHPEDKGKDWQPVRWKVEGECDWVARQAHQDRISEGLELFGKYYQGLWS